MPDGITTYVTKPVRKIFRISPFEMRRRIGPGYNVQEILLEAGFNTTRSYKRHYDGIKDEFVYYQDGYTERVT